ncbi:MAG: 2-amino-4-hydroxy-6-hydroxymethyldihydropteridine diphosphokinase, partial [Sediminibacterium sp.]|nr:2-amino-4-hydroxy-6-hydroxymethyldihydropteridine diphosphokinase [Sediminibacterium sp.]
MQQIYLGIGTNQGNKLANLDKALFYITQLVGQITNVSAVYKTDPWGFLEQPFFYNMVIKVIGNLDYETCLEKI